MARNNIKTKFELNLEWAQKNDKIVQRVLQYLPPGFLYY